MKIQKITVRTGQTRWFTPGVTKIQGGVRICVTACGETCSLILREEGKKQERKIPFPEEGRVGNVWSAELMGDDFDGICYCLEIDGKRQADPAGREFAGQNRWGDLKHAERPLFSRFCLNEYDWEGDRTLKPVPEEMILYRLHVRGFTKHASSGVRERGTFCGIAEKIPYLKELGITAVELMIPNEFSEVMTEDGADGNPYATGAPTGKLNYWGYGESMLFAPKASYSSGREKKPERELKDLVKELHRNGISFIPELYFTGKERPSLVQEAARFWVCEYHADGIHLSGFAPTELLADDPVLADTLLLAPSFAGRERGDGTPRHLAEYNDGFLTDMRRVLKGDEDQVNPLIYRTRHNPAGYGTVNYMAGTNGFTMADMVMYERKHNEANGENNRDGSDYNYTWNCGAEGPSRKKKIMQMRRQQLRNAYLLLFLSQGTPLLLAGDEFGNSQSGNNNAYCQDNEISWLNWNQLKSNRDLFEFVKTAIAFRREHPVFRMKTEPKNVDYLVCGHPDVSYHGVRAWCPEFENFRRQLGIMYCGEYGRKADGKADDYFFVAYNMHWEPHEFALPKLPKGMDWHLAFNTSDDEKNGIYPEGREPLIEEQKRFLVPSRTIAVFRGIRSEAEKPGKKDRAVNEEKNVVKAGSGSADSRGSDSDSGDSSPDSMGPACPVRPV